MGVVDYVIIRVFFVGIFWLGSYFYRWIGKPDDFYIGGTQINILTKGGIYENIEIIVDCMVVNDHELWECFRQ